MGVSDAPHYDRSRSYGCALVPISLKRDRDMQRSALALVMTALLGLWTADHIAPAKAAEAYDPWPGLVQDIFNNRPMNDGADVLAIEMPTRAEDASLVPVTLRAKLAATDERRIRTITLVIDQNPAPMAAKFTLGEDANVTAISTRVRVNNYTDVHAVAELSDGKLYVAKTYVKASGGCSAPAAKNPDVAAAHIGQMRYRAFTQDSEGASSGPREAQVMVGHPNNSGLQMDQLTQLYIPAYFVDSLKLTQDGSLVLAMEGGISISEDPNLRFTYVANGARHFRAEARDTQGHLFEREWPVAGSGS